MTNAKGFTVIEMLVGMFILLIVILITTSFFRAQSKFGGELMKDTGTRESVAIAMTMIKRDLMQGGQGLTDSLPLSFWADRPSNELFHVFYIANGYYLTYLPKATYSPFRDATFKNVTSFSLPYVRPEDIGGVLTFDRTTKVRSFITTTGIYNTGTGLTTFTLGSSPGSTPFVPVISYKLVDPDTLAEYPPYTGSGSGNLELKRNGITLMGGKKDHTLRLQDFGARLQFVDASSNITWIPSSTSANINDQPFSNLKGIEVQLRYQTLRAGQDETKTSSWRTQVFKIMTVTPRNVYLMGINQTAPQ